MRTICAIICCGTPRCTIWNAANPDRVLALYDADFRNPASKLTQSQPDLYIDVQNAASMLFRLQRHGVDVGDRWVELADKAEARIGDCLSAFTLPHWMMALAATGRYAAAARMLDAMRALRTGTRHHCSADRRLRDPGLRRLCWRMRRASIARAVAVMRPALGGMYRLGGSHAQQDVLEQFFLDAALQAGQADDARLLLERVAARYPLPLRRRTGYATAADQFGF